jgi:hypothetical protein
MSEKNMTFENSSLFGVAEPEDPAGFARAELHSMLSSYLRGEEFAVRTARRICEHASATHYCHELIREESEHVEMFKHYILEEYGSIADLELPYQEMLQAADAASPALALLVLHTVIEPFGLGSLSTIVRNIESPVLKKIIETVIEDETRHIQLPSLHPEVFRETLMSSPATVAAWLDECVIAMSSSTCPTKVYERFLSAGSLSQARASGPKSRSVVKMGKNIFTVLSRVRRSLLPLVSHLRPLNDLMGRRYQTGAFARLSAGPIAAN